MLTVISTFALDFIHGDRSILKSLTLTKHGAFSILAQGETYQTSWCELDELCDRRVLRYTIFWGRIKGKSEKQYRLKVCFPFYGHQRDKADPRVFRYRLEDENNQKRS